MKGDMNFRSGKKQKPGRIKHFIRSRVKVDDAFIAKYTDPKTWASDTITAYNAKLVELETEGSDDDDDREESDSNDDDVNRRAVVNVA